MAKPSVWSCRVRRKIPKRLRAAPCLLLSINLAVHGDNSISSFNGTTRWYIFFLGGLDLELARMGE